MISEFAPPPKTFVYVPPPGVSGLPCESDNTRPLRKKNMPSVVMNDVMPIMVVTTLSTSPINAQPRSAAGRSAAAGSRRR